MNQKKKRQEEGQSIVIIAGALVVLIVFAALAVDLSNTYSHRRTVQNAADAASLAGARSLAAQRNSYGDNLWIYGNETAIKAQMNDFAERNGVPDTGGQQGDAINDNVYGYYLGNDGSRVSENVIGSTNVVPADAAGVEAFAQAIAPTFFGGILGLDGIQVEAEAAVIFESGTCGAGCIAPIATMSETFLFDQCYNFFDGAATSDTCSNDPSTGCNNDNQCNFGACDAGFCAQNSNVACTSNNDCLGTCEAPGTGGSGNFGWLNWSMQGHSCQDVGAGADCAATCIAYNLTPGTCLSGLVEVSQWVGGTTGVNNSAANRELLQCYANLAPGNASANCPNPGEPMTVIVYDGFQGTGCEGGNGNGTQYHVAGFAKFQMLGYSLSTGGGGGSSGGHDGTGCLGPNAAGGNRITGIFLEWVSDPNAHGGCTDFGISVPRVVD